MSVVEDEAKLFLRISSKLAVSLQQPDVFLVIKLEHTEPKKYRVNDELADVVLICGSKDFGVHLSVLHEHPHIKDLLIKLDDDEWDDCESPKRICLKQSENFISTESFEVIIQYLYSGRFVVNEINADDIQKSACLFHLKELEAAVKAFWCHRTIFFGAKHSNVSLEDLNQYLGHNVSVFLSNLTHLCKDSNRFCDYLVKTLQSDVLVDVNEDALFSAIHNSESLSDAHKKRLLFYIRTHLLEEDSHKDLYTTYFGTQRFIESFNEHQRVRGSFLAVCVFCQSSTSLELLSVSLEADRKDVKDLAFITNMELPEDWKLSSSCGVQVDADSFLFAGGFSNSFSSVNNFYCFHPFQFRKHPSLQVSRVTASLTPVIQSNRLSHISSTANGEGNPAEDIEVDFTTLHNPSFSVIVSGGIQHCFQSNHEVTETVLDSVEKFENGLWTELCSLPRGFHSHASTSIDGSLYITGGISCMSYDPIPMPYLFKYDLEQGTSQWHQLANMNSPRWKHTMTYHNRQLWVMGGDTVDAGGLETIPCTSVESYSLEDGSNRWIVRSTAFPYGCVRLRAYGHYAKYMFAVGSTLYDSHHYLVRFDMDSACWDNEFVVEVPDSSSHVAVLPIAIRPF